MTGFWDSIVIFFRAKDLVLLLISIIMSIFCVIASNGTIQWYFLFSVVFLVVTLQILANYFHHIVENMPFVPLIITQKQRFKTWCHNTMPADENTILHSIIWVISDFITVGSDKYEMKTDDINRVKKFIVQDELPIQDSPLLILLIESMESWVVHPSIMPNMHKFINQKNILYCPCVKSQIKQGISADGQLIINTGLLPIQNGATSYLFPNNVYPSIMKISGDNNMVILPRKDNAWNKEIMLSAYGLQNRKIVDIDDRLLFKQSCLEINSKQRSVWTLTVATHAPFTQVAHKSKLSLPNSMPAMMRNYISSFNVLDDCFIEIIKAIESDETMSNTNIIITGDHTIIPDDERERFRRYCVDNNLDYVVRNEYCPLIIHSPKINKNRCVSDIVYQMDIYPTMLSLIGCNNYWWKGFGVDLLDERSRCHRPISEKNAYELSDKIIRSNFFSSLDIHNG